MAEYLAIEYLAQICHRFTTLAAAIAESMEWDAAALKNPISANESLCWDHQKYHLLLGNQ